MLSSLTSRQMLPIALLASAALVLTGCGSAKKPVAKPPASSPAASPTATAPADPCTLKAGAASNGVTVSGAFGKTLTASFSKPLNATSLQRTVVTTGTGNRTAKGQKVDTMISVFLGSSGKNVLPAQAVPLTVDDSQMIPAFNDGISCVSIGSRVVVAVPAKDVYGTTGNPNLGIQATDTMVIVTDVLGVTKPLVAKAWTTNLPTVTFSSTGVPKVTLPTGKPSPDLELKVLRQGTGTVVGSGDSVTLNYQGTSWDTRKIFDQSYGRRPATFATTAVVRGFGAALVGQKVGTRLIVTIPPRYAYGEKGSGQALAGQTLVFVIEIQRTVSAAK
jgi:FKBP-type peptidyl-prolyl cis-trans isomerase